MLPASGQFIEDFIPSLHRLVVYLYDDVPYDRRPDPFIRKSKVNVGTIAAVELENWPHCRAHLLALHVCSVTGNTHSEECNKGRDDCFLSAGHVASPSFPR